MTGQWTSFSLKIRFPFLDDLELNGHVGVCEEEECDGVSCDKEAFTQEHLAQSLSRGVCIWAGQCEKIMP